MHLAEEVVVVVQEHTLGLESPQIWQVVPASQARTVHAYICDRVHSAKAEIALLCFSAMDSDEEAYILLLLSDGNLPTGMCSLADICLSAPV